MKGTILNTLTIILGSLIGVLFKRGISEKLSKTMMQGLALCIIYIGIQGTLKGENTLVIIISMVLGSLVGEVMDLDKQIKKIGDKLENKFNGRLGKISEAFITTSLLFCVGAMAIVGALESGLQGNNEILYAKSILDCISSIIFSASLGIGVIFSSIAVFIYQGSIAVAASCLKDILVQSVINNITSVGSLLIIALGLNMLDVTKIKVANFLPAVFIPILYYHINSLIR